MVTLLGFFFILGNIGLLVVYMPDLVGPVRDTPRCPPPRGAALTAAPAARAGPPVAVL